MLPASDVVEAAPASVEKEDEAEVSVVLEVLLLRLCWDEEDGLSLLVVRPLGAVAAGSRDEVATRLRALLELWLEVWVELWVLVAFSSVPVRLRDFWLIFKFFGIYIFVTIRNFLISVAREFNVFSRNSFSYLYSNYLVQTSYGTFWTSWDRCFHYSSVVSL